MLLAISGHDCKYQLESFLMLFLPLEKIQTRILPREQAGKLFQTENTAILADCRKWRSGLRALVLYKKNGQVCRARLTAVANERDVPMAFARLLFPMLQKQTGITPPWGLLTGIRPVKKLRTLCNQKELTLSQAQSYLEREYQVRPDKAALAAQTYSCQEKILHSCGPKSYSLYISIPFCPSRCSYCSFVSQKIESAQKLTGQYVALLCKELEYISHITSKLGLVLESIYVGGGTPTTFTVEQIKQLLACICQNFDVKQAKEFTFEAGRADTITDKKLQLLKEFGVDRISINPQSFNNAVLQQIGRKHTAMDVLKAYTLARQCEIENINMDVIAALPGDTMESFTKTIDTLLALSPENITLHSLSLKRASSLTKEAPEEGLRQWRQAEEMLTYGQNALQQAGYQSYYMYRQKNTLGNMENVGYMKKARACLYNVYMMEEVHTILSAGAGAVTKLVRNGIGQDSRIQRIYNFKYPYEYIQDFAAILEKKKDIEAFYYI